MLKKLGVTLLCVSSLIAADVYAAPAIHTLRQGMTLEYEFPPNSPQDFNNFTWWTIEATCRISTPDSSNDMFVKGLEKKGKINGYELSRGQTMMVTVRPGDLLRITADSGAAVQITNLGKSTVKATCST